MDADSDAVMSEGNENGDATDVAEDDDKGDDDDPPEDMAHADREIDEPTPIEGVCDMGSRFGALLEKRGAEPKMLEVELCRRCLRSLLGDGLGGENMTGCPVPYISTLLRLPPSMLDLAEVLLTP